MWPLCQTSLLQGDFCPHWSFSRSHTPLDGMPFTCLKSVCMPHRKMYGYITADLFAHWMERILIPYSGANAAAQIHDAYYSEHLMTLSAVVLLWPKEPVLYTWYLGCSPSRPVTLLLDNHAAHLSLPAIRLAVQNNIHVITIPAHASHLPQPFRLDFQRHKDEVVFTRPQCTAFPYTDSGARGLTSVWYLNSTVWYLNSAVWYLNSAVWYLNSEWS